MRFFPREKNPVSTFFGKLQQKLNKTYDGGIVQNKIFREGTNGDEFASSCFFFATTWARWVKKFSEKFLPKRPRIFAHLDLL